MLRIAVLDDGICSSFFPFGAQIKESLAVMDDGAIVNANEPDGFTHGTLCAAIIHAYAPDADIVSIKVIDHVTLKGSINQIRYALDWCVSNDISVINLSVGYLSLREWQYLRSLMSKLIRNNIPLICACSNNEKPSIFTDFSWVFSVEMDRRLVDDQYYSRNATFFDCDFVASSTHTFITSEQIRKTFSSQNSHAAPVITAKVVQLIGKYGKLPIQKLRHLLYKNSIGKCFHIKPLPDFVDTAIILGVPSYPHKLLAFSQDIYREHNSQFFYAIFPNASLDINVIETELNSRSDMLAGILYAGIAPAKIKEIAHRIGCLFWDESEYLMAAARLPPVSVNLSSLKILLRGSYMIAAYIAKAMMDYLIDANFRCKIFSDWPQAYCIGMVFLAPPIDSASYINAFSNYYQLDTVLICSNNIELVPEVTISCYSNVVLFENEDFRKEYSIPQFSFTEISKDIVKLLS